MSKKLNLRVNGSTSNLGSGFDTLGLAVSLPLIVQVSTDVQMTEIHASGEGLQEISGLEDNLFLTAFEALFRQQGEPTPNCRFELKNHIPLKRGLGSSGAAIVAGLLAANKLIENSLSAHELFRLACRIEGHPENVSASLFGGLTINCLHEGNVFCETIPPPVNWKAVCFIPEQQITTPEARSVLPAMVTFSDAVNNLQTIAMTVIAFRNVKPALLKIGMADRLHEPYRRKLINGYDDFAAAICQTRAHCFFISGSGSTMMAICDESGVDEVSAALRAAASASHIPGRVMQLDFVNTGAVVHEQDR